MFEIFSEFEKLKSHLLNKKILIAVSGGVAEAVKNVIAKTHPEIEVKIAKAEGYPQPYTQQDIERTMKHVVPLTFEDTIEL